MVEDIGFGRPSALAARGFLSPKLAAEHRKPACVAFHHAAKAAISRLLLAKGVPCFALAGNL